MENFMDLSMTKKITLLALATLCTTSYPTTTCTTSCPTTPAPHQEVKDTTLLPTPSSKHVKKALKFTLKAGEEILPYVVFVTYFMKVAPRIENYIKAKSITPAETDNAGTITKPAIEKFIGENLQTSVNEMFKCFLGVWCCETFKKHATMIKDALKTGKESVVGE